MRKLDRRPRIHQLLPAAHQYDATGDSAEHLARVLRAEGYDAGLYALTVDGDVADRVRPFEEFPDPGDGDLTILHFAVPSRLSGTIQQLAGRRALVYHNLTPPDLLAEHAPEIARLTAIGRRELGEIAASGAIDLAIGVSSYNTRDLDATGFESTATLPLPVDLSRYAAAPDALVARGLRNSGTLFLTVGRVAPNKRLEDFLRIAAYYLRYIDPDARFVVVGSDRGLEAYGSALSSLHAALGLDDRVRFVGRVSHAEMVAYYRAATVYVCTSVHEGFCVPLLEAMYFDIPVLARGAAAVPETLGDAGVKYTIADPAPTAEMLHLLATDRDLRDHLIAAGRRNLADYSPDTVCPRWVETLTGLLA